MIRCDSMGDSWGTGRSFISKGIPSGLGGTGSGKQNKDKGGRKNMLQDASRRKRKGLAVDRASGPAHLIGSRDGWIGGSGINLKHHQPFPHTSC